jgi:uncharacterized repeat protein (TIGR02543 family)
MVVRRRSGLAIHRRAYAFKQFTPVIPTYTVTYNGNTNTSGTAPVDGSSPYTEGSTVTILGNSGSPVLANSGFTFDGWNTVANGSGTSYSQGNTFTITANTILYAKWTPVPEPPPSPPPPPVSVSAPISLSSVGGNQAAYILFTQSGTVTNYEYSTDDGVTFLPFSPAQIYSPVEITVLSSDGVTRLTNGTTYTVRLKAVNSGSSSSESAYVTVVPMVTSLATASRIIYLDANNSSSYSGTGSTWTNLDSGGNYSATLNGTPPFNTTDSNNKYFDFNRAAATGQFAQIGQATAINPVANEPFTIQMWVRINNVGAQGSLVSKVFSGGSWDGYAVGYRADNRLQLHENGSQVNYFDSVTGVVSNGWTLYTANIQFGNGGERQNKLFVNGRQILSVTSTDNISSPNQNLTFPTGFYGEGECDIGQFYYYNTELTTTQIIQNYDATKPRYTNQFT